VRCEIKQLHYCRLEYPYNYVQCCPLVFFFFFQAEDGIRDRNVTGVQTCALPIFLTQTLTCVGIQTSRRGDHLGIEGLPRRSLLVSDERLNLLMGEIEVLEALLDTRHLRGESTTDTIPDEESRSVLRKPRRVLDRERLLVDHPEDRPDDLLVLGVGLQHRREPPHERVVLSEGLDRPGHGRGLTNHVHAQGRCEKGVDHLRIGHLALLVSITAA